MNRDASSQAVSTVLNKSLFVTNRTLDGVSRLSGDDSADYQAEFDANQSNNSLMWTQTKLFGRSVETTQCMEALNRCSGCVHGLNNISTSGATPDSSNGECKSELITIFGKSGCGKSALAETLRRPALTRDGYYTEGKFDQYSGHNLPYSALISAFTDLVAMILENANETVLESTRQRIVQGLGADTIATLSALIPNLGRLAGVLPFSESHVDTTSTTYSRVSDTTAFDQAFGRLKLILKDLVKAIACKESPIVMFLDDIQWSDEPSMQLLHALASDVESKYVLIVVAFRNDGEVQQDTAASRLLQASSIRATEIHLTELSQDEANQLVSGLLETDTNSTLSLTEALMPKTGGNPFAICQILKVLRAKGFLIRRGTNPNTWEWDISQIQAEISISDNVMEIVAQRIETLNPGVRFVLQFAACIGHRFQMRIISTIIEAIRNELIDGFQEATARAYDAFFSCSQFFEIPLSDMSSLKLVAMCISFAMKEGVIESCETGWFKFSHDRFQQFFYECIGESRQQENLMIGKILQASDMYEGKSKPSFFYMVVDQLNEGYTFLVSDEDVLELIRLNVDAAKLAKQQSAYWTARTYLDQALLLRDVNAMWDVEYDLALDYCTLAAEMNHICGDYAISDANIRQVAMYGHSFEDKLPATITAIVSFSYRGYSSEATKLIYETLDGLNRKFPKQPNLFHVLRELARTNRTMKNPRFTDDALVGLPELTDSVIKTELQLLRILSYCAFDADNGDLVGVCALRMIRLTCKYGFCDCTAYAFAVFGLVQSSLGNIAEAVRFGTLTLRLLSQSKDKYFSHRTLLIVWDCCLHYRRQLGEVHEACQISFEEGMVAGLTYDLTTIGSNVCLTFLMHGSKSLRYVSAYADALVDRMAESDFTGLYLYVTRIVAQAVTNHVSEEVGTPWLLNGHVMQESDLLREAKANQITVTKTVIQNIKLQLAVFFNNWKKAHKWSVELGENSKAVQGHFSHFFHLLYSGITYTVVYNRKPSWRSKRWMLRKSAQLKKLADNGVVICVPLLAFLQAERSAGEGDMNAMVENFTEVIRLLQHDNYKGLQALAMERLARNIDQHFGEHEESQRYMTEAIALYEAWGATRIVKAIRDELPLREELSELKFISH